jgi:protein O-mannosyl-transferase
MPKKKYSKQAGNHADVSAEHSSPAIANRSSRSSLRHSSDQNDWHFWDSLAQWKRWYVLLPVMLALLTSINGLENEFAYDDNHQILRNDFIKNWSNLPQAFTSSVWSFLNTNINAAQDVYFRPLFTVLFMVNHALFGTQAWGWHLVNVLIHTTVTYFVFIVCREISGRNWLAFITAALFAVHPVHAESVAWISGITDPLMALFALPSFYYYLKYRKEGRRYELVMMLTFYFLALMSKETALSLPVIIAYCELFYFKEGAPFVQRVTQLARLAAFFVLPVATYFAVRYNAFGNVVPSGSLRYPPSVVITTIPLLIVKYLKLMMIPSGYSILHFTAPGPSVASLNFLLPIALLLAIGVALIFLKSRLLWFASVWFIVWLSLSLWGFSGFYPLYSIQERYLYLPSLGVCLAVALGIEWIASLRPLKSYGPLAAGLVATCLVVVFSFVYIKQNRVWKNDITLDQNAVQVDPQNPYSYTFLALAHFSLRNYQEAKINTQTALDIDPTCIDAYLQLSVYSHREGKIDEGIKYLELAEARVPDTVQKRGYLGKIYGKLGFLYNEKKDFKKAEENLRKAVELTPVIRTWYDLGEFYLKQGDNEKALEMFEKVVAQANHTFAPIHLDLARAYDRLGQLQRAKDEYNRYVKLAPYSKDRDEALKRLLELQQ